MNATIKASLFLFLIVSSSSCFASSSDDDGGDSKFSRCSCDEEEDGGGGFFFLSAAAILECQRVSDVLIAVAYFSIPVELLYFVSCSNFPFKWVLFQFIAFIVLCGTTHLLNSWTFGPHTFRLAVALTVFKLLTALVSFATAITLVSLIPLLLKVKVREFMLMKKAWDLDREVGLIRRQTDAGLHVRMLTREIRRSLDRHTILHTTLVELSKTLELTNCAVWMPNAGRTEMNLTHEFRGRNFSDVGPVPTSAPDVRMIKGSDGVKILDPESPLALGSTGGGGADPRELGPVAAIRMPMLKVANFKQGGGGAGPEMAPSYYAILVLVLRPDRAWTSHELEIVEVVADQVAVALSHASVLEESRLMRDKLEEQNRALQKAKEDALMASRARDGFQTAMSRGLKCPMHSIVGLLSILRDCENTSHEQRLIVESMVKAGGVLSTLISDTVEPPSARDGSRFPLEMRLFSLHSTVKEACCVSKCLCTFSGWDFSIDVDGSLPDRVVGDERRVLQVILHMVGNKMNDGSRGCLVLRVYSTSGSRGWAEDRTGGQLGSSHGFVFVKFEVGVRLAGARREGYEVPSFLAYGGRKLDVFAEESMSFKACKKLVQLMQGDIRVVSNPEGSGRRMALLLRFQIDQTPGPPAHEEPSYDANSIFRGLDVLVVDSDDVNRAVTAKMLERLGCLVTSVSRGEECIDALVSRSVSSPYRVVIMDLQLRDSDGLELASRVCKFRSRSRWPLIVALTSEGLRDEWVRAGVDGAVRKPCSYREVGSEMERVLLQADNGNEKRVVFS